jgi:hypothetical protein
MVSPTDLAEEIYNQDGCHGSPEVHENRDTGLKSSDPPSPIKQPQ